MRSLFPIIRAICLILPIILCTSPAEGKENRFRVIRVKTPFDMGQAANQDSIKNDYYVTVGLQHGLQKGNTMNVYRNKEIVDEMSDISIPTRIFIGQMKSIEVHESYCIARIIGMAGSDNPLRERDAVLVGDFVLPVLVIQGEDLFAKGSATLLPKAIPHLEKAKRFIHLHQPKRAIVEGHTDNDGSAEFNMNLSEQRAATVRDYMISQGKIDSRILFIRAFGESRPIAPNDTLEGQAKNRRFEIVIER